MPGLAGQIDGRHCQMGASMAFTDNCDLFASLHEEGINRVVWHIMRQRPSWLNFATADVAANRELWCQIPDFSVDVTKFGNPIFTILPDLPVIGADSPPVGLGFCVQVANARIDLAPTSIFELPPELGSKLDEQHLAIELRVCGSISCPDSELLERIPVITGQFDPRHGEGREPPPPVHVPGRMNCFCLDVFVVAHVVREFINGVERVVVKIDGVEIVDIEPKGLEENIECYIRTALTLFLRQKLAIPLSKLFVDFPLFGLGTVTLAPTPVPHNPAIEEDQLKAFVTMTVMP